MHGPNLGKGGTGTLTVDGRVLLGQKMEHSIPFMMSLYESLDIGLDTRSPAAESYKLPFSFPATINQLTYTIKPGQLSASDRMRVMVAAARDTPAQQSCGYS